MRQARLTCLLCALLLLALAGCSTNTNQETNRTPPAQANAGTTPANTAAQPGPSAAAAATPAMPPQAQALLEAAGRGDTAEVKKLLDQGVDVNSKSPDGRTALTDATYSGHTETVKLLLERHADPNARKNDGATSMQFAKNKGNKEIVALLKKAGAKDE